MAAKWRKKFNRESMKFVHQTRSRCWCSFISDGVIPLLLNRKGEYAMDLVQPYRLVFEKTGEEIQVAKILEIVDYH